jgi:hypothetical protein
MATSLLACPFCRELYDSGEAEMCPVCGVVLKPLAELPPSLEVREQLAAELEQVHPGDRPLPWHDMGRNRGLIALGAALGLVSFFAPWIVLVKPELRTLTGFDLFSTRGYWFASGALGWFICIPLVLSRRSVYQMRGVRAVVGLFCSLTACQVALLLVLSPNSQAIPLEYHWGWGFYTSAALSVATTLLAVRLGGVIPEPPTPNNGESAPPISTEGHTLH